MVGLIRRGEYFYFRQWIPLELRSHFGRSEVLKSLRTKKRRAAIARAKLFSLQFERLFMQMRSGMLSKDQIRKLVKQNLDALLGAYEEMREEGEAGSLPYNPVPANAMELEESQGWAQLLGSYHQGHLVPGQAENFEFAYRFLKEQGVLNTAADELTEEEISAIRFAARELSKSFATIYATEQERLKGNYSNPYDQTLAIAPPKSSPLLSQALEKNLAEIRAKGRTEKTCREFAGKIPFILKLLGDKPVHQYERADFIKAKEILNRWPKNANAKAPEAPISDVLERTDLGPCLGPVTVHKYLVFINSVFNFCVTSNWIDKSPCPEWPKPESEGRLPFDRQDIENLLNSPYYSNPNVRQKTPQNFWVPLIALYSGMRIDEICQLHLSDIRQVDGIWCFHINDEGQKKVKTPSSRRLVPIHTQLVTFGFQDYWASLQAQNQKRLWPQLKKGPNGFSHNFTKSMGHHIRRHVTTDRRKTFHSIRKAFAANLTAQGVGQDIISCILGHSATNKVTEIYSGKYPPAVMMNTINMLDYELDVAGLVGNGYHFSGAA